MGRQCGNSRNRNSNNFIACGCGFKCLCGKKCHACSFGCCDDSGPFRRKYVCLKCKRCWKDKYSRDYIHPAPPVPPAHSEPSRCSNCGKEGSLIGDKFRPPKKHSKEWDKLDLADNIFDYYYECEDSNRKNRRNQQYEKKNVIIGFNTKGQKVTRRFSVKIL